MQAFAAMEFVVDDACACVVRVGIMASITIVTQLKFT